MFIPALRPVKPESRPGEGPRPQKGFTSPSDSNKQLGLRTAKARPQEPVDKLFSP